jgi:hypothetical protein
VPFTPSHAVVALAFVRTPLVPAAVAVGAMTPDLPLFVRAVIPPYAATHGLPALPLTVAMALGLLLVWRCGLRPAAGELSPAWLARRLPAAWNSGPGAGLRETFAVLRGRASVGAIALLVLSLTVGVLSHIVWDLFTHEDRWGSQLVPALAERWGPVPGYTWLQHSSSALGLVVLAVAGAVWLARRPATAVVVRVLPTAVRVAWWISLPVVLAAAAVIGLAVHGPLDAQFWIAHLGYRMLPPACALWAGGTLVLTCVVAALRARLTAERA